MKRLTLKQEMELSKIERCNRVLDGATRGLEAVFADKAKVEIVDNESILIDGWIYLTPTVEIPAGRTIKFGGKNHVVNYSEEQPLWMLSTARFIPQTRWEPEDVDITDAGTFHFGDAMHLAITLIAKNIYNQFCESESEKEMDEMEKDLENI